MPLTEYQKLAVETRGGARLVSAAAGSGKTKVLVERLMRYVEQGADIDDFLVITYTRAAAGELRGRILSALNDRIAQNPHDRRLRRQTELCCRASIGTIDSVCGRFLRENAHLAGIAPDFRVVEPDRAESIRKSVLDRMMDKLYDNIASDPDLRALVDSFGSGRDDSKLADLVLRLHSAIQSHPDPQKWLDEQRHAPDCPAGTDAGETAWGRILLDRTAAQAGYWAEHLDRLLEEMQRPGREKLWKAYGDSLSVVADGVRDMARSARLGWENARRTEITFPRFNPYRGDDPLSGSVVAARDSVKKAAAQWGRTFADDSETLLAELRESRGAIRALLTLTGELDRAFAAEKKRQGVVDFSDQEHMVLRLLEDTGNGLAEALSSRYREVLVDEYQDVNACQDRLFTLLSGNGQKLFMVGDVKQSIYRFRLADPSIFLDKFSRWHDVTPDLPAGEPGRILLRENFRSRRAVVDAVNHVFSNIMSPALGELAYDEASALRSGREFPAGGDARVEMVMLSLPEAGEDERPDKQSKEAEYIAGRIRELVDSRTLITDDDSLRPVNYGDIAILLRSNKSVSERYRAALSARGIPSVSQQGGGFFRSLEVTVLLSMLAVIDNPRQDVALIAALRSPLYGFTADELSAIRAADKNADFFTALTKAAGADKKCAAFLQELESYRAVKADESVEKLLCRICETTDLFALLAAMPDGSARRENVNLLMDFARQYELDGYRGVFSFIGWMKRLEERGEEPRTGSAEQNQAVQIISIHHSKGLEYPIVFLAGTAKRFNKMDSTPPILIHSKLGIGAKIIDTARGVQYPTLAWRAAAATLEAETLSEEMRVLYVAMTRAKDRLFITGLWDDPEKELNKLREGLAAPVPPVLLAGDVSMGEWLARAALLEGSPITLRTETPDGKETVITPPRAEEPAGADTEAEDPLSGRLGWHYPMPWAAGLPSKVTASLLKGTPEKDADGAELIRERPRFTRRPDFSRADAPLTGTEKGVAIHSVMQFIDFEKGRETADVEQEIERLRLSGHLTDRQARSADPALICAFFRSELGKRAAAADEMWRELRFSLLIPAEECFDVPSGEQLLLQGVVDCCIREGDALTVIDYKTDYVDEITLPEKTALYSRQIRLYAKALTKMLGLPVKEGALFFLRTGTTVKISLD